MRSYKIIKDFFSRVAFQVLEIGTEIKISNLKKKDEVMTAIYQKAQVTSPHCCSTGSCLSFNSTLIIDKEGKKG